jgi:uncharacterized protein YcaQ
MAGTPTTLTAAEARKVALCAQGILGARRSGGPGAMVGRLGGVQLDTISVLARSHELVAYARHGAIRRESIEQSYWGPRSATFEYWSHAACIVPLHQWPAYGLERRARRAKGRRWHLLEDERASCAGVMARIESEGPLTARELGGAKKGGPWWDWSEVKIAAEWLLDIGELVCRERRGFQRVYDLAERAIPSELFQQELTDDECAIRLVGAAADALGVATLRDLTMYNGVPSALAKRVIGDVGLIPADVEGWGKPAWVAPGATDVLQRRVKGRSLLISPFDSLTWDRPRTQRLFDFHHRLEAYVPRHKRLYGYFAMPLLAGTELVGLVDPGRRGSTLVAKQVSLQSPSAARHAAVALAEAATWVGCDDIVIERVDPVERTPELLAFMAAQQ